MPLAVWKVVLNISKRLSLMNFLATRQPIWLVRMEYSEKVTTISFWACQLAAPVKSMDWHVTDKKKAMAILSGLLTRLEQLILIIDAVVDDEKLTTAEFLEAISFTKSPECMIVLQCCPQSIHHWSIALSKSEVIGRHLNFPIAEIEDTPDPNAGQNIPSQS